jgi:tRNA A-37 threonylcarbamoyl transferase component Bud32
MQLEIPLIRRTILRPRADIVEINPRHAAMLESAGLTSAADFLNLHGPIIGGHPDRHVLRVTVGGQSCYLKREHRVPLRDRFANCLTGFGLVSVSRREAWLLGELKAAGIPAPEWLAAGEADGRAFLLLNDVGSSQTLRDHVVRSAHAHRPERRRLARRLAMHVARIHDQGFAYPDLYAKHILVDRSAGSFTFLDWQRSRRRQRVTWAQRCRDLAALNASLPDDLADADDRLTFLLAYRKAVRDNNTSFRAVCARIQRRTRKLLQRSSIREQRLPVVGTSQGLYWIDGERLCVTADGRDLLDPDEVQRLAYDSAPLAERRMVLAGGVVVRLTVRRSLLRLGRWCDALQGRRWQAPECRQAAQLLREERLGKPRRLLAFGQWERSWGRVDSFLLQRDEPRGKGEG